MNPEEMTSSNSQSQAGDFFKNNFQFQGQIRFENLAIFVLLLSKDIKLFEEHQIALEFSFYVEDRILVTNSGNVGQAPSICHTLFLGSDNVPVNQTAQE